MFTNNKFLDKFYTNSFLQLNVLSKFLANTSLKQIIAFRPLIEGLSNITSSA